MKNPSLNNPTRKSATKVLTIYSKKTGALRRLIDADDDHEYDHHIKNIHPGEGILYLTHKEYDSIETHSELHHYIAKKVGFPRAPAAHVTRHAHIDHNDNVINIIEADLSCGDSGEHLGKGHLLIQHPHAQVGWKHINGELKEKI